MRNHVNPTDSPSNSCARRATFPGAQLDGVNLEGHDLEESCPSYVIHMCPIEEAVCKDRDQSDKIEIGSEVFFPFSLFVRSPFSKVLASDACHIGLRGADFWWIQPDTSMAEETPSIRWYG